MNKIKKACVAAINLAEESKEYLEDNTNTHPAVGAVILDAKGNVLATGIRNEDAGKGKNGSHAEVISLRKLKKKDKSKIDTIVTTLEPCSLRRRQDVISCARRVVRSGIRNVIIGSLDPGIGVRGRGAQLLQTRNIYFSMFPQELNDIVIKYNREYLDMQEKAFGGTPKMSIKDMIKVYATFDLDSAPQESLCFLRSKKFREYTRNLYRDYKKEFEKTPVKWEDYYAAHAVRSQILERKKINSEEGTVFEQLATYLAVPPNSSEEHKYVYWEVGQWWINKYK